MALGGAARGGLYAALMVLSLAAGALGERHIPPHALSEVG